ncbi:SMI1/KNR4 family protein [Streptomyces sp. NPDC091292]|uniref:SMI1/KNR4 family protein n=1 Tax=Streptomyces sp. NPDC091292 TaxID=3365991 RepID=UPI003822E26C
MYNGALSDMSLGAVPYASNRYAFTHVLVYCHQLPHRNRLEVLELEVPRRGIVVATLSEIRALLGEPRFNWSDPAPWIELEQELGLEFPADFREIVDAYGSIEINGQLYLKHPAGHLLHSLGKMIREDLELWRDEDMTEFLPHSVGANPGELMPVAFSEWLLAYLQGRDVTLCSRNTAPDGPFYAFLP